jgi:hypothetical protein
VTTDKPFVLGACVRDKVPVASGNGGRVDDAREGATALTRAHGQSRRSGRESLAKHMKALGRSSRGMKGSVGSETGSVEVSGMCDAEVNGWTTWGQRLETGLACRACQLERVRAVPTTLLPRPSTFTQQKSQLVLSPCFFDLRADLHRTKSVNLAKHRHLCGLFIFP